MGGAEEVASEGKITFDDFLALLEKGNKEVPGEGPDPKVLEFLRILEEYRVKCEDEVSEAVVEVQLWPSCVGGRGYIGPA